jgi:hypothetical protein
MLMTGKASVKSTRKMTAKKAHNAEKGEAQSSARRHENPQRREGGRQSPQEKRQNNAGRVARKRHRRRHPGTELRAR